MRMGFTSSTIDFLFWMRGIFVSESFCAFVSKKLILLIHGLRPDHGMPQ